MKQKTKNKLTIIATSIACISIVALTALNGNYSACIWELYSMLLLAYLYIMDMHAKECHRTINKSIHINKKQAKSLKTALGKNEAMIANCKRYQAELKELRTYAKNTDRRADKRGTASGTK